MSKITAVIIDLNPVIAELSSCSCMFRVYNIIPLKRIISRVLSLSEDEYLKWIQADSEGQVDQDQVEILYHTLADKLFEYIYRSGIYSKDLTLDSWVDHTSVVLRLE